MKKILLHACCAPCSTAVIEELLKNEAISVTVFFYNPNIHPISEYHRRKAELKMYLQTRNIAYQDCDDIIDWKDQVKSWFYDIKGFEHASEKNRQRCEPCIRLRLEATAHQAKLHGFDTFGTTLTISPHKDAEQINRIGREVSQLTGVDFLVADYKQNGGFFRSLELSRQHKMYRQNYCGCVFSRRERVKTVIINPWA